MLFLSPLQVLLLAGVVACSAEGDGSGSKGFAPVGGSGAQAGAGGQGAYAGTGGYAGAGVGSSGSAAGASGAAGISGQAGQAGESVAGASGSATAGVGGSGVVDLCRQPLLVDTPSPEVCGNGLDDDLNGFVDEVSRIPPLVRLEPLERRAMTG